MGEEKLLAVQLIRKRRVLATTQKKVFKNLKKKQREKYFSEETAK